MCNEAHPVQNRCRSEALLHKVVKLMEANALIPQILQHNKEATETAMYFQDLLKKADQAHTVLMEILARNGEIGEKIKNEYLEELDKWAKVHIDQDTEEFQSEKLSALKETKDSPSIGETQDGETTVGSSSQQIQNATLVEKNPQS